MAILHLVRPELMSVPDYKSRDVVSTYRLHANELPWSPIENSSYNCYPSDEEQADLEEQLAQLYGITTKQLVMTRGSDQGIDLLMRLFLSARQDALLCFPPTFPMYAFYARLQQVELIESPLEQTNLFSLSLDHVKASWQPHCKMIILCNPNNPTGGILNLDFIAEVCSTFQNKSLIVVDEAYIEFANTNSAISLLDSYDNLIILRTLSKAYGLAGIRLGSIIAQESIIATLTKIIAPYTISSPTLRIATQALIKVEWFQSTLKKIIAEREQLLLKLPLFQWIEQVYTSQTNFILLKTPIAQNVADYLEQHQIGIRQFLTNPLLRDHLRITVGTEEQNALLLTLLSTIN